MKYSAEFDQLAGALADAQGKFGPIPRSARNPQTNKEYSTLDDLFGMIRGPLSESGLSVQQSPRVDATDPAHPLFVTVTRVLHKSAQWVEGEFPVPISPLAFRGAGMDAQAYGSASTYSRKYGLMAILGIAPGDETDDDGNAASGRGQAQATTAATPQRQPATGSCPECRAPAGSRHASACSRGREQAGAPSNRQSASPPAEPNANTQGETAITGLVDPTRTQLLNEFAALPNMPANRKQQQMVFESCLKNEGKRWDWDSPTICDDLLHAIHIFTARNEARAALVEVAGRAYGTPVTDEILRAALEHAGFPNITDLWLVNKRKWNDTRTNMESRLASAQAAEYHGRPEDEEEPEPMVPSGAGVP